MKYLEVFIFLVISFKYFYMQAWSEIDLCKETHIVPCKYAASHHYQNWKSLLPLITLIFRFTLIKYFLLSLVNTNLSSKSWIF